MISSSIEIYTHLRKLLAVSGVSKQKIRVGAHLGMDLELGPEGRLEWIRSVEEYFNIEIDHDDKRRISKVSDVIDLIANETRTS